MKDIIFGWLTKPAYKITALDSIICGIECIIVFIMIVFIYASITTLIDEIKEKKKRKKEEH